MKEIIIKCTPFVFKQTVFIKEGDKVQEIEVPHKELASFLSLQAGVVDKVHIFGNEKYAIKIKEECITKYKVNNMEICINS